MSDPDYIDTSTDEPECPACKNEADEAVDTTPGGIGDSFSWTCPTCGVKVESTIIIGYYSEARKP